MTRDGGREPERVIPVIVLTPREAEVLKVQGELGAQAPWGADIRGV